MARVRVAFLGTGGIAAKHTTRMSKRDDVEIVGGCDVRPEAVDSLWKRTWPEGNVKLPPAFTDAAKMYQETKPDAVVICTPHTLHFDHGMQALNAGIHVLMEKPMVTAAEQAYKLAEKVKQTGKVLLVGYNTPCSPEFAFIRQTIRDQSLGKLELVTGRLLQGWKKATVGLWRQKPELSGGGQAYDSGAHLLNSLCWSVACPVAEVFAFVDNCGTPVDINSSINIRFENGVFAAISIGGNCPSSVGFLSYAFDNGRIDCDGWGASWMDVYKGHQKVKYPRVEGEQTDPADNFIDSILGKAQPAATAEHGIIQSELMDAIYESARTGQPAKPKRK